MSYVDDKEDDSKREEEVRSRLIDALNNYVDDSKREEKVTSLINAAKVILLDKRISEWLNQNDPKAHQQLKQAVDDLS